MFRENVLIALTILITILALSFVILMTVYLQIHEMDKKLAILENLSQKEKSRVKIVTVDGGDSAEANAREHEELLKRARVFWDYRDENGEKSKGGMVLKTTTTPPPPIVAQYPLHVAANNPHKLNYPVEVQVRDASNADVLTRMINEIKEYEMRRQIQEIENRILHLNEVGRAMNRPWYRGARKKVAVDVGDEFDQYDKQEAPQEMTSATGSESSDDEDREN